MSDTSQGSGWWLASDDRWYPPELHAQYRPVPSTSVGWTAGAVPPPAPQLSRAGGRRQRSLALTLLIGGATCGVLGLALFVAFGVGGLLGSTVYDTPVHVSIDCRTGTYYVFQETGSQVSVPGFSYTHTEPATLTPGQVLVVSPHGRPISTWSASGNQTITKGSRIYSNAVGFDVPAAGSYSVTITSRSVTAVIIAPSLGGQFLSAAPWLILSGIGFPVATLGLVLLILESNRRKRESYRFSG